MSLRFHYVAESTRRFKSPSETGGDEELRELSIESLNRTTNELQEEIAIYDAHQWSAG